ncbi:mechanosensitive ion channel domain-containing protein [Hoeflea sp.]|uniref:mechanosensitive ion channel domain-containing protein n=1 Tax=Hoeflea sp. TaxID=1940281 RepID=UPI003A8FB124
MRLNRLIVFMLAALLIAAGGARAQTSSSKSAPVAISSPVSPAPEVQASAAVVAAQEKLASSEKQVAKLKAQLEESATDDSQLVDLKVTAEALARSMLDIGVSLRPRITEIKARIDQLGAAPAEGEPAEPEVIVAERARLAEERAEINALTGRAETVSLQANEIGDQIAGARRDLFANTLFKRTEITPTLIADAFSATGNEWSQLSRTYGSWATFVWKFKRQALLGSIFFSLLAALVLIAGAYRLFGGLIIRDADNEDPPYTSRLSVAFWSIIIPTMAMTLLAALVFALMNSFAILRADVTPVIQSLIAMMLGVYFISKLARAILAPKMPAWRLVNVSNGGARVLFPLVVAMAVINGLDYVEDVMSNSLGSPVVLTVMKGFISVFMMALVLIAMALVKPMVPKTSGDPSEPGQPWPRIISRTLLVAGIGLMVTALLGYVGLARFAATQIVVTGGILTTMYIGYLSGQAVSEAGSFANTTVGRWLQARYKLSMMALDQSGLGAGLLINLLVLLMGVPLILLQWGFQIQDIEIWFYRLMTDIRIGGITISLVGILFGVVMFVFGLIATRWFQRWLDGSVMARGRMDTGVRNSIKTGIGYLGVAVAALIGISVAGIDLSSLALVAGALSLGIGFGLQNIVSNFVSGLILLAERPFKVGDWVVTGSTEGFVKKISVRATEIETFSRQSIIVPNSELINAPVGNWTHRNKLGRVDVPVGVSYDADPRRVIEILSEIARGHELVLNNPEPSVHFVNFGDSSLDFELKAHVADVLDGLSVRTELRLRIFERLKEENIEIPFPQRDLNIKLGEGGETLTTLVADLSDGDAATDNPSAKNKASVSKPSAHTLRKRRAALKAGQDSMEGDSGEGDR